MSITGIKKRLLAAKRLWKNSQKSRDVVGLPGFIPGVLHGFQEALTIIRHYQQEEIHKTRTQRKPLSRWNGILLYKACSQAYLRLKHSDRPSAMRILQRALGQVNKPLSQRAIHPRRVVEGGDIPIKTEEFLE